MLTQAVILVGGLGTRLGALTRETPKPLIEVAGRPFVEHVIQELSRYGCFEEIVLLAGYRADAVRALYDGRRFGKTRIRGECRAEPPRTRQARSAACAGDRRPRDCGPAGERTTVSFVLQSVPSTYRHVGPREPLCRPWAPESRSIRRRPLRAVGGCGGRGGAPACVEPGSARRSRERERLFSSSRGSCRVANAARRFGWTGGTSCALASSGDLTERAITRRNLHRYAVPTTCPCPRDARGLASLVRAISCDSGQAGGLQPKCRPHNNTRRRPRVMRVGATQAEREGESRMRAVPFRRDQQSVSARGF